MSQVAVNGRIWRYEEIGAGEQIPPILVLHGWGRSGAEWMNLAHRMSKSSSRKVYVVDLPGFGGSSQQPQVGLPKVKNIYEYASLVKEFCDYMDIKKVILVGHSLGGRVGIVIASMSPTLVEKLILVDPAGVKVKSIKRLFLQAIARIFGWVPKNLRNKLVGKMMDEDYRNSPALRDLYRAVVSHDLTKLLPQIKCETMVIWGEKDPVLPLSMTKVYRDKISNCRVRVVWEAKHDPHLTHPRELERLMEEVWT